MIKINLPRSDEAYAQIKECLRILNLINLEIKENKAVTLDLSNLMWILPCSAVLLSSKIYEIKKLGINIEFIEPKNEKLRAYLSTVGFPFGKNETKQNYMPIYHFSKNVNEDSNKVIELMTDKLFEIIREKFPADLQNSLFYVISELSDNIDQHSEFTNGSVMLQCYNSKGYVDIAVLDNGLGIPGSYEKHNLPFEDDVGAIENALRGVSTKKESGRGTGLQSSKKIITEALEGNFHIISRNGFLSIGVNGEKIDKKLLDFPFRGTFLHMRFKIPKKDLNIYNYLS